MQTEQLEYGLARYGTPLYVFDLDRLTETTERIRDGLGEGIGLCYAMKANPFLTKTMAKAADRIEVCSMGEFEICRNLNIAPEKLFISGVVKKKEDLSEILNSYGGRCVYTVESVRQFHFLADWSDAHAETLTLYLRLESGSQFGMDRETVRSLMGLANMSPYLQIRGIHFFSGTQKKHLGKLREELEMLDSFIAELNQERPDTICELEYGPGIAVPYFRGKEAETYTSEGLKELGRAVREMHFSGKVTVELGRALAAECGYYLTQICDVKNNGNAGYCLVDGGTHQMNYDGQIRGMYEPVLRIMPEGTTGQKKRWTVCGSLCTVNDVLCREVELAGVQTGKVLVFERTGAYSSMEGMALFLSHELPQVVLYSSEDGWKLARKRKETYMFNMTEQEETDRRMTEWNV